MRKIRIKNPFSIFFKPKEKPDDPLARIPEEWKKKAQPTDDGQAKTEQAQETRRGPGRPPKKAEILVPPANVKTRPEPQPQPKMHTENEPKLEKRKGFRLPSRTPVKLRSYQQSFRFRSIPHFRQIKRWYAAFLLGGMILATGTLFFVGPIYTPLITLSVAFILIDYIWVTALPKTPKETIKFSSPELFAEWLRKQNVTFEVDKKEEKE